MEDTLEISFEEDRYSRFELIPWWNQDKLRNAKIMVVGAGAIGNEIIKNLALLGIGHILIVDLDRIEQTNLTRSVLFRREDVGRFKAEVAAERAMELNPDVKAMALNANVVSEIGLGIFKQMDMVLGGLDNREARYSINQSCYRLNKTWIDGAIEVLNGFARVFSPPGPCYECTMSDADWKLLNQRRSCTLLRHEDIIEGKTPTTSTSSSVIAAIQVQEMLKLIHNERKLPTLAGKGFVFNGLTHDSYVAEYQKKDSCMSHDSYDNIISKDWSGREITLKEILHQAQIDLGHDAILELDRDIIAELNCVCGNNKVLIRSSSLIKKSDIICEMCGKEMLPELKHIIIGDESFLEMTPFELGIPLFHIIGARKAMNYIYYEFCRDKKEILGGFIE